MSPQPTERGTPWCGSATPTGRNVGRIGAPPTTTAIARASNASELASTSMRTPRDCGGVMRLSGERRRNLTARNAELAWNNDSEERRRHENISGQRFNQKLAESMSRSARYVGYEPPGQRPRTQGAQQSVSPATGAAPSQGMPVCQSVHRETYPAERRTRCTETCRTMCPVLRSEWCRAVVCAERRVAQDAR